MCPEQLHTASLLKAPGLLQPPAHTSWSLRDAAWVWYRNIWPPALPICSCLCSSWIPAVMTMLLILSCGAGAMPLHPTASQFQPLQQSQLQLWPHAIFNGKWKLRSSYFSLSRVRLTVKHFSEIKADFCCILLPFWKGKGAQ